MQGYRHRVWASGLLGMRNQVSPCTLPAKSMACSPTTLGLHDWYDCMVVSRFLWLAGCKVSSCISLCMRHMSCCKQLLPHLPELPLAVCRLLLSPHFSPTTQLSGPISYHQGDAAGNLSCTHQARSHGLQPCQPSSQSCMSSSGSGSNRNHSCRHCRSSSGSLPRALLFLPGSSI